MIRLRPIDSEQTFSIIPASYNANDIALATIYITDEETKVRTPYLPAIDPVWFSTIITWNDLDLIWNFDEDTATEGWKFVLSGNTNFLNVTILSTTGLKEGSIYTFEIIGETSALFKDTIFVTAETDKSKIYSNPNTYKQYDDGADSYIVI